MKYRFNGKKRRGDKNARRTVSTTPCTTTSLSTTTCIPATPMYQPPMQPPPPMGQQPMPPGGFKFGPGAIILLIGGLLLIVGLFMPYVTYTISMSMIGTSISTTSSISGWQLATEASPGYPILFLVLVMGILALISPFIFRKAPILGGIFGIIGVLCAIVGWLQAKGDAEADISFMGVGMQTEVGIGIGLIVSIIGGILALVGGILAMKQQ